MPESSPDGGAQASVDEVTAVTTDSPQVENQPGSDATGADSSSPKPAGTMIEAVQAALDRTEGSPSSSQPDQPDKADSDVKAAEGESEDELSEDELKALNWKTQQRFKKLTSTIKQKDGAIADLKQKADDYDRIVGSITKAGLDNREVDELIEVGAMLKGNNPRAALEKMLPIVEALQRAVGEVLSPELQEQVRLGYITEQHARELQRAKAGEHIARQHAEKTEADRKAREDADDLQKRVQSSVSAVEAWEKTKADKDPDWHLKRDEVAEQVKLAILEKSQQQREPYFPTPKESVELSEAALKKVNERLKRFAPRPSEIRPTTPGASTRTKPAPKSTLDAINNALG